MICGRQKIPLRALAFFRHKIKCSFGNKDYKLAQYIGEFWEYFSLRIRYNKNISFWAGKTNEVISKPNIWKLWKYLFVKFISQSSKYFSESSGFLHNSNSDSFFLIISPLKSRNKTSSRCRPENFSPKMRYVE